MASKKLKNKVEGATIAPSEVSKRLYLDFEGKDVSQIKGLAIGERVMVMVEGTIKGLSQRQREDYNDPKKTVTTGSIDLESYTVTVMDDEKNEFTKMANEE